MTFALLILGNVATLVHLGCFVGPVGLHTQVQPDFTGGSFPGC